MLTMIIVTSRSRDFVKSPATSCFLQSLSCLNALIFIEERENREVSAAEKNPERNNKTTRVVIRTAITAASKSKQERKSKFGTKYRFGLFFCEVYLNLAFRYNPKPFHQRELDPRGVALAIDLQ